MKVLFFAPYIYDKNHEEFSVSSSGFGYMVNDILCEVSKIQKVALITHKFTSGYTDNYRAIRHTKTDVLFNMKPKDFLNGVKVALTAKDSLIYKLRYAYYYINVGCVRNAIQKFKPDVIHIHGLTMQTKPIIELCEELDCKYVVTLHGLIGVHDIVSASNENKKFEHSGLKFLEKKQRVITVVSSGVKKHIQEDYHLKGDNINVVLNGITLPKEFERKTENKKKYLMCVGSISKRKNQIQLIRVIDLMSDEERKNIEVHIVGSPSSELDILSEINKRHLENVITFHGFIPREEISSMWKKADLNVIMSRSEGFGLSIIEGYSYGVPCVAFDDIDAVIDLYDSESMTLINEYSDDAALQGIREALSRKWNRNTIIKISKRFSLQTICDEYVRIYNRVVGR